MVYKEMLVELIVTQYENAKNMLEDFPGETEIENLVDELEDKICVDMSVESSDPDTEVEVKTSFEQRARNTATRNLENQLSSAKKSLETMKTSAQGSLIQAMQEDLNRVTKTNWSWDMEDDNNDLWSSQEWLESFQKIEAPEAFWKKIFMVFSPDHIYVQSMLFDNAVIQRYPIIKNLESMHMTQAWNWVPPFLNRLRLADSKNFDYQQVIDKGFRNIWTSSASLYALTGDPIHKNKCQLLQSHGFTPAPAYIDLTGIFGNDAREMEKNLSRLMEISGMQELLAQSTDIPEKVYGFQYLAAYGTVSSSAVSAILNKENPVAAAVFSKLILEINLQTYSDEKQGFKVRKM